MLTIALKLASNTVLHLLGPSKTMSTAPTNAPSTLTIKFRGRSEDAFSNATPIHMRWLLIRLVYLL